MKPWPHMPDVDTDDVNQFEQQLLPGSTPINLRQADGKTKTVLIRKIANPLAFSVCDDSGLQPMTCDHGLTVRRGYAQMADDARVRWVELGAELPPLGRSWMRGNAIVMVPQGLSWEPKCPVCIATPESPAAKDAMIKFMLVARDGTVPPESDLPEWAR